MVKAASTIATLALALAGALAAGTALADPLKPGLQGLGFLLGDWSTPTRGHVADTGGMSAGVSHFTPQAGGAVILRNDHVALYDRAGKPGGDFDIIMMIYLEAGRVHADYADGDHVIHYDAASIDPGHAVTFTSPASGSAPSFKLSYTLRAPEILDVGFFVQPPGSPAFHPIATGSLTKSR